MRKLVMITMIIACALCFPPWVLAQGLSGTYMLSSQGTSLTLVLQQDAQGNITGNLTSSAGGQFQVEGIVQDGVGVGTCSNDQGGVFFEAQPQGNQLQFALIEPGQNNMPDYNKVKQLLFTKKSGAGLGPQGGAGIPTVPQGGGVLQQPPGPFPPAQQGGGAFQQPPGALPPGQQGGGVMQQPPGTLPPPQQGAGNLPPLSSQELSDPNWGFRFRIPQGWKVQKGYKGAVLGHDSIAGMILVVPHMSASRQEVQNQMLTGLSDEGLQLMLTGQLTQISTTALAGEYSGMAQGQPVKARGIGTISPHGGGAYIIALTTPDKYGTQLSGPADAIATGMQFERIETSNLTRIFIGTWTNVTTNTMTSVTLFPDGTYSEYYEAGYSGQFNDQSGNQTGNWGTAREDRERGRWIVRGGDREGVITFIAPNGGQDQVAYRVHVERGETYWREYWFNGKLYRKK